MALEIMRLDRKIDRAWTLWPQLRARIHAFGTRGHHADIDLVCNYVESAFIGLKCPKPSECEVCAKGQEHFVCWIIFDRETNRIAAHLLGRQDLFNGAKVAFVLQAEGSGVPLSLMRMVHFEFEQWAASTQGKEPPEILMLTHRIRIKAWARMFRYQPYRMLMRWEPRGEDEVRDGGQ